MLFIYEKNIDFTYFILEPCEMLHICIIIRFISQDIFKISSCSIKIITVKHVECEDSDILQVVVCSDFFPVTDSFGVKK